MKIQTKLFIAFFCSSLFLVASMYALVQWSFDRGLLEYVNTREQARQQLIVDELAWYYQQHGDLSRLRSTPQRWDRLMRGDISALRSTSKDIESHHSGFPAHKPVRRHPAEGSDSPLRPPRPHHRPPPWEHEPPPRRDNQPPPPGPKPRDHNSENDPLILLSANKDVIFGGHIPEPTIKLTPIEVAGKTVGWLAQPPRRQLEDRFDVNFLKQQSLEFLSIGITLIMLATLIAFPLSKRLVKPIKKLLSATGDLSNGKYDTRVNAESKDELGQLSRHFNELAKILGDNETARKRWVADISHELRTPIAITRGELEAMIDGIRPLTLQQVQSTHHEVLLLQQIVEDLYQLTNADIGALSYQRTPMDLSELINTVTSGFQSTLEKSGLTIESHLPTHEVIINGDHTRLHQLLHNLVSNSIKYTDAPGNVCIRLTQQDNKAKLIIEDSAPGVPDESLPLLFDYLYRVDSSRNRKTGGSGLGLAICQKIAEGHDGTIKAFHSEQGGLSIHIELPL